MPHSQLPHPPAARLPACLPACLPADVKLFEDQGNSDSILDDLACMLGCTRSSLNGGCAWVGRRSHLLSCPARRLAGELPAADGCQRSHACLPASASACPQPTSLTEPPCCLHPLSCLPACVRGLPAPPPLPARSGGV